MLIPKSASEAQKICKMYGFLNKDIDPSHVSEWIWDPVLTDYWFNSGSVTLASTLPPCASSTGAAVASTTGSATGSSVTTTTGSASSGQTQTASRSITSLRPHSCLLHLFTYSVRSAQCFDHRPSVARKIRRLLAWFHPRLSSQYLIQSRDRFAR